MTPEQLYKGKDKGFNAFDGKWWIDPSGATKDALERHGPRRRGLGTRSPTSPSVLSGI